MTDFKSWFIAIKNDKTNYIQNISDLPHSKSICLHNFNDFNKHCNLYEIKEIPGLILIKHLFTHEASVKWYNRCMKIYPDLPGKSNLLHKNSKTRLRWLTFGLHHNWDTKVYNYEDLSPIPDDIIIFSLNISKIFNFDPYNPEAVIVNYYEPGDILRGHIDASEIDMTKPLISLSFGYSAIFLVQSNEERVALLLEHGDILLMSGDSRLAMHGVPKVFPNDLQDENLFTSRVNINIRQVFPNK